MATNKSLTEFKTALKGGGARANLFEVSFGNIPTVAGTLDNNFLMLCKAANLPASNVWWDVAPAEVSTQPCVAAIRTDYEAGLSTQRWHA